MKVSSSACEAAIVSFLERIVSTMPTSGHKFLAGAMVGSSSKAIKGALTSLADSDGLIDTDEARKLLARGLAAAGEKVTFEVGDERLSWLLRPVKITITAPDLHGLIDQVERNS